MTQTALSIRDLRKSYPTGVFHQRRREVLRGLTLNVHQGEIFGYLGPNGSGKTTTLKVLMRLVFPDFGECSILGCALSDDAWRYRVGYLPEHPYFYDYLTAGEYLEYVGRLFSLPATLRESRSRELLETVGLARTADLSLRRFSKGMVQRLGIAQALINDPEMVFLDEPMSGLDPIGRRLVRNLIRDLRKRGKTVFFSTHILSDAETLCDRVALIWSGELVAVGRLDEILKIDVEHLEVLVTQLAADAVETLPAAVTLREPVGERWRLHVEEAALGSVIASIEHAGGRILSVQPIRQSLEDLFVQETASIPRGGTWSFED